MGKLVPIYSKYPFVIIAKGFRSHEWEFLNSYLRTQKVEIYYWETGRPEAYLHPEQILLTSEFSEYSLKMSYEWSLPLSVIGRLDENEKNFLLNKFVTSFWDLEKIPLPYPLPLLGKTWDSKSLQVFLWSSNFQFAKTLQSIFRFFPVDFVFSENPSFSIQAISQNDYHLVLLDWDNAGLETIQIIRELRKLKPQKKIFPSILGLKDFNKMHIFKDLISGIKEFCPVLFNEVEIIELFLRSFPIIERPSVSVNENEFPVLRYAPLGMNHYSIYLDYKKDTRKWELESKWTWTEIEQNIFREQFLWLLKYFKKA